MDQGLIKRLLYTQALTCPIAMIELVKQFGALSPDDRLTWINSMTADESFALGYTLSEMNNSFTGRIMQLNPDYSVDMADYMFNSLKYRAVMDDSFVADFSMQAIVEMRNAVTQALAESLALIAQ